MADTAQSAFWKGDFGDAYVERNKVDAADLAIRLRVWSEVLRSMDKAPPKSILEVGANIGGNMRALKLLTSAQLFAIEPNKKARDILSNDKVLGPDNLKEGVAQDIPFADGIADLVFTSGVLIHVHPDHLLDACREIYRCSSRYIGCIEYFSAKPEEVTYRGHTDTLWKRDFGSYWLEQFPDLECMDHGFAWRQLDNSTWWVFEKPRR